MSTKKPVLCYWDIRGLGQAIRILLKYTGTEFEDKLLSCGPAPDFDRSCWLDQKFKLGLDFPNLPYYIDGDIKLTQSNAILRFVARKYNKALLGRTEKEDAMADMMAEEAMDLRNAWIGLCYGPNFDKNKAGYVETLNKKLAQFSAFLGKKSWYAGEGLTFVDFMMYELIDENLLLVPDCLRSFPNIREHLQRFERLPQVAAYMRSPDFMKYPINNKMAACLA